MKKGEVGRDIFPIVVAVVFRQLQSWFWGYNYEEAVNWANSLILQYKFSKLEVSLYSVHGLLYAGHSEVYL